MLGRLACQAAAQGEAEAEPGRCAEYNSTFFPEYLDPKTWSLIPNGVGGGSLGNQGNPCSDLGSTGGIWTCQDAAVSGGGDLDSGELPGFVQLFTRNDSLRVNEEFWTQMVGRWRAPGGDDPFYASEHCSQSQQTAYRMLCDYGVDDDCNRDDNQSWVSNFFNLNPRDSTLLALVYADMSFIDNRVHSKAVLSSIVPYDAMISKKTLVDMDQQYLPFDANNKFSECK